LIQVLCDLLGSAPLRGKDKDRGNLLERLCLEKSHQCLCLLVIARDGQLQIQAREVRLRDKVGRVLDVEYIADVFLGCLCSCCSKADDACLAPQLLFNHLVEHEVGGAEVVTPLRGTMDLVNADHANLATILRQILHE